MTIWENNRINNFQEEVSQFFIVYVYELRAQNQFNKLTRTISDYKTRIEANKNI